MSYACLRDLTLSFAATAANSGGLRISGTDTIPAQDNDFENIYLTFAPVPGSTGAGIYATSYGNNTDVVLNTFRNIIVTGANKFAECGGCEGNFWIGVQGMNIGHNRGAVMFEENRNNGDEIVIARMESGSSSFENEVCYSTTGSNNLVTLTCDSNRTGITAVRDSGRYNSTSIR